jgi:hypothetical protein
MPVRRLKPFTDLERPGELVNEDEIYSLLEHLKLHQPHLTKDQAQEFVDWVHLHRTAAMMVDLVLRGDLWVSVKDGHDPVFGVPNGRTGRE